MSFSYDLANNPRIAYVRLLIPDTQPPPSAIFSDEEINAFYAIQAAQFQSGMFYSAPAGRNLPSTPVSYLRVAALALDTLANNSARLGDAIRVLDVSISAAAKQLRDSAKALREIDDDAGAFAIVEQCSTVWAFRDRFENQILRISGGGIG